MKDDFPQDLLKLITYAVDKKIYGSIEVYFEQGKITQITQRIINKVNSAKEVEKKLEVFSKKDEYPKKNSAYNSQITKRKKQ